MSNEQLVSVIIPCYNHEKYVQQAVESVLEQTYRNIELIVIDDGSSDNSPSILSSLAKRYNFNLILQKNMGVCRTLNNAIRLSKGQYIAMLASDDYWHLKKIEMQMLCLKQHPKSKFCYSQAVEFEDSLKDKSFVFPKKPMSGRVLERVFLRQHVPAGTILFSRELYDYIGGFDENLEEEDWDFIIRCAAETEFCVVREPLLFYRSHDSNVMKTRPRMEIFRQKALLLSKNLHLVSPLIWLCAILVHFLHDYCLSIINKRHLLQDNNA